MGRARKYNKRIEIWQTTKTPDGFGGYTVTELQLTQTWAQLRHSKSLSNQLNEIGIFDPNNAVVFRVRKRRDLNYNAINQFIIYNGNKYLVNTQPRNVGFDNAQIEFIATIEATRNVETIAPIGGTAFPYTFDFIFEN